MKRAHIAVAGVLLFITLTLSDARSEEAAIVTNADGSQTITLTKEQAAACAEQGGCQIFSFEFIKELVARVCGVAL